jgi:hypothetical protein
LGSGKVILRSGAMQGVTLIKNTLVIDGSWAQAGEKGVLKVSKIMLYRPACRNFLKPREFVLDRSKL